MQKTLLFGILQYNFVRKRNIGAVSGRLSILVVYLHSTKLIDAMSIDGKHKAEASAIAPILKDANIEKENCEYDDAPDAIATLADGRRVGIEVVSCHSASMLNKHYCGRKTVWKFIWRAIKDYKKAHNINLSTTLMSSRLNTVMAKHHIGDEIKHDVWQDIDNYINKTRAESKYIESVTVLNNDIHAGRVSFMCPVNPIPFKSILYCINKKEGRLESYKQKRGSSIDEYWLVIDITEDHEYSLSDVETEPFQSGYARVYISDCVHQVRIK